MKRQDAGFTLIEMLVVIGVIGIVVAATVVAFAPFMRSQSITTASMRVKTAVLSARTYAINYRYRPRLYFSTTAHAVRLYSNDGITPLGDPVMLPEGVALQSVSSAGDMIIFSPTGQLDTPNTGAVRIVLEAPQQRQAILWVIAASGLIYSE